MLHQQVLSLKRVWRSIMAASKKKKVVKQKEHPECGIRIIEHPDKIMKEHPSWVFTNCDTSLDSRWRFTQDRLSETFWRTILPKLKDFESMTYSEILIGGKKSNHSNDVSSMNKVAQDRLRELKIEAEALVSLRINGKCRIYGYIENGFNILWFDDDHGDNKTCVYRSILKHT